MDLLKTILLYMTMVFASSVQNAPEPTIAPAITPGPAVAAMQPAETPAAPVEATPTPTPVPTPDITPNNEYKTIKVGDNGEEVSKMQRRLAELGYYTGDLDGRFGNQTRRAVERFQYNNGLGADGIAGKRTLTVLYESKTVVAFTDPEATPTPPAELNTEGPELAQTVNPDSATFEPTFIPTVAPAPEGPEATAESTPEVQAPSPSPEAEATPEAPIGDATQTPAGEETAEPSAETDPPAGPTLLPLTEVGFALEGTTDRMTREVEGGAEPIPLVPLEKDGEAIFVPFLKILESSGVVVVPSVTEQRVEYAFAILGGVYHLSVDLDEKGVPGEVVVTTNGAPQIMGDRTALMEDGILYLPLVEMEKWTGIAFALNEETQTYTVTLPVEAD